MNYLETTKEERQKLLTEPYEVRLEATKECIRQVLTVATHPIIQFSGGADSCVMADIIHKINPHVPCLFNDWGLFLPEQEEFCLEFFKKYDYRYFVSRSGVYWADFISKNGFPIFKGFKYIPEDKYKELGFTKNCRSLKNKCWSSFRKSRKIDYYFVGMLADESPQRKSLFIQYGFVIPKKHGDILVKPIILLSKKEVFKYLKDNKVLYPKNYYSDTYGGETFQYNHCDLGCFMCGIRFNEKGYGRLGRIARQRPDLLYKMLDMGLRDTLQKITLNYPLQSDHVVDFLHEYDKVKITAYDLDGVLCIMPKRKKSFFKQIKEERDNYERDKIAWFRDTPCLWKPHKPFYIISGRRQKYGLVTDNWLQKHSLQVIQSYFMEGSLTFENILNHKLKYLKLLRIERFFEDDLKLVKAIRKECPDMEVIHVPRVEGETIKYM